MIKIITAIGLTIMHAFSFAQTVNYNNTISYKHNALIGQDATVWQTTDITGTNNCTPLGLPASPAITNYGDDIVGGMGAWSWSVVGCPLGTLRFFIRFPELSILGVGSAYGVPAIAIDSAILVLHGIDSTNTGGVWGNNYFPGTPLPNTNEGWIYKVQGGSNSPTNPNNWNEHTITWNSAMAINMDPTLPPVAIPVTNSRYGGEQRIDVTTLVKKIVADAAGEYFNPVTSSWVTYTADVFANNGFMLELQNETLYRSQAYATSDNPDSTLWPELRVSYHSYGNCDNGTDLTYSYTNDPNNPLDFTFSANSPGVPIGYQWYISTAPTLPTFTTPVSTSPSFNYTFPAAGEYIVVMSTYFCQDIVRKWIHITVDGTTGNVSQTPQKAGNTSSDNVNLNENTNLVNSNFVYHVLPQDNPDLSEVSKNKTISIHPNPTNDDWIVNINARYATLVNVILYDAFGKVVVNETRSLQTGSNTFKFPATNLSSGLYIMEFKGEGLNSREKLIKK